MVLRVYAMYNKSRIVMGGLLVLYVSEIILFSLSAAYYNSANILTGTYRPPLWKKSSSFGPPPDRKSVV